VRKKGLMYYKLWYFKKRNIKTIRNMLRLVMVIVLLLPLFVYTIYAIYPGFETLRDEIDRIFTAAANDAVKQAFSGLSYDDIVIIKSFADGGISSIELNKNEIDICLSRCSNLIRSQFAREIQAGSERIQKTTLNKSLELHKSGLLSQFSLNRHIEIQQVNSVVVSDFEVIDEERTKHKIAVKINTRLMISAGLFSRTIDFQIFVPVMEVVIFGGL